MKKRPKWFQQTSFNQPNTSDTSYCVFKNLYPSSSEDTTTEEISTQNITTDNKPSSNEMTKDDFLIENVVLIKLKKFLNHGLINIIFIIAIFLSVQNKLNHNINYYAMNAKKI